MKVKGNLKIYDASKWSLICLGALLCVLISSCQTYHITTQSLLQQLENVKKIKQSVDGNGQANVGFIGAFSVEGNDLPVLKCLNEDNDTIMLDIDHRTGIRITKKDGSHVTFYFNTLLIKLISLRHILSQYH
jgi:hypothetical protein